MSLQDQLDTIREEELAQTPPAHLEVTREAMRYLRETGAGGEALGVGDRAPDFALPDTQSELVSLRPTLERGPVILDFFRGGWCPFCSLELRAYQQLIESIEHAGASLLAISPETPQLLRETAEANQLTFPVLSDHRNEVARRFGLVYTLPEALRTLYLSFGLDLPSRQETSTFELPVPATYLVDTDGVIRRAFHDIDPSHRGEPQDFIDALRDLRTG
ncbi:MAG TPA: peroxiredoxin-like family protein [Candidatus Krumholzibacteria bacterium]|nr:peroxiredoxin-like family protein [Candidatus Krumholzibacteria bacterium]